MINDFQSHLTTLLSDFIETSSTEHQNHFTYTIAKENLVKACKQLKDDGARLITMVGSDEREINDAFSLYYVFAFDDHQAIVTVHTFVKESDPTYPSVTNELPACNWYEREVYDLLGLEPVNHPHLHSLMLHGNWPDDNYPLRKDYPVDKRQQPEDDQDWFPTVYEGDGVTRVPVGPIHAGIIEPGHFLFGVAGDAILHLDAQLFFKHRGVEKSSERRLLHEGVFIAERTCGTCALSHAVAYSLAVENLAQIDIPKRAKILRMIYLELERLSNHIGDIGDICSGAGFHMGSNHGARLKEELQQLNEQVTGHRFLRGIITLGGVREDLDSVELKHIQSTLTKVKYDFTDIIKLILNHEITLDRMETTGILLQTIANDHEVVGPAGRASGRQIDIRKSHPYLLYDKVDLTVPTFETGDVLARVHVRIEEIENSFTMINQLIDMLEDGPITTEFDQTKIKPYSWSLGWTESALGENVHWVMVDDKAQIYRYRIRSAPYNNWPAVPTTVEGNIVPDFPIINKSFELCYSCCDR